VHDCPMDLLAKLQLRPGSTLGLVAAPEDSPVSPTAEPASADALLAFVRTAADLDGLEAVYAAARADRLTWIAYPKAGRLGTDLNRDRLAAAVTARGLRPVRQVALDDTWSALRFRPGTD
jgi:hypothetical protein